MEKGRGWIALPGTTAAYALLCAYSPDFARAALNALSLPATAALHRLTAPVPFPAAEALAAGLAAAAVCVLAEALCRAAHTRSLTPLGRWLKGIGEMLLTLACALTMLWSPARALPFEAPPEPDAGQLEWLCGELVAALNASPLRFPDAEAALSAAPATAGLPGCAVKAARYPEWMRALRVSGLFMPLTGEALTDGGAPAPLIPFTAVHELMHLRGIADEGAANIEAWRRCIDAGGPFADSARLWALRYALGRLGLADGPARLRIYEKMEDPLRQVFHDINGEVRPAGRSSGLLPGLALTRGDYGALVGALCQGSAWSVECGVESEE